MGWRGLLFKGGFGGSGVQVSPTHASVPLVSPSFAIWGTPFLDSFK